MANNGTVATAFPSSQHHCKDCGVFFESGKSLEVHLQYHKENLLSKWATQAQSAQNDLENNNNTKIKREATIAAPADSSDAMITKPSPEFQQRSTPETSAPFGHPATPQSYHSAPSPYQTPEQTGFSPGQFPPFVPPPFAHEQPSGPWEQGHYAPDFISHKVPRFHPYGGLPPDRSGQVSSSSPVYGQPLSQPTPSPSPKQCDKCGFVCDSAAQLNEHCSTSHPPTPQGHFHHPQGYPPKHYGNFVPKEEPLTKEEHEESADILDLDSQKVVHPGGDENGTFDPAVSQLHHNGPNPHPVSAMLPWPEQKMYGHPQMNGDPKMFSQEHKMFSDQKAFAHDQKLYPHETKMYPHEQKIFNTGQHDGKNFIHQDQKLYQPHQLALGEYQSGVSTSGQDIQPPYRPFDSPAGPQISSTQATNPSSNSVPPISGKGANWKSNEARRPKTYNCTACNKWFTSSGHLKRHYNTTLHKNAVRSSGQPDPATLPISTHHHPSRDPTQTRGHPSSASDPNTQSPLPSDDVRSPDDGHGASQFTTHSFDRPQHPGMQQPVKGPYMHQQSNIGNNQLLGNNPLANHPLPHQMGSHPLTMGNQPPGLGNPLDSGHHSQNAKPAPRPSPVSNSVGSPPNGQAGPSVLTNHHSRGLLSTSTSNTTAQPPPQATPPIMAHNLPPFSHFPGNPYSPRPSDLPVHTLQEPTPTALYLAQNFQQSLGPNYPNGMSPHVMDTASNNLPITSLATIGEILPDQYMSLGLDMPPSGGLPSFSQFQSHRYGLIMPNYSPIHNVGGSAPGESPHLQTYLLIDGTNNCAVVQQVPAEFCADESSVDTADCDSNNYHLTDLNSIKQEPESSDSDNTIEQNEMYSATLEIINKYIKQDTAVTPLVKQEEVTDISNKENYESQVSLPPSPVSVKLEYENNGSPSISSTVVVPPLSSSNKNKQASKAGANDIHKCFECDKLFNKACYLTQHNKSFHSGDKPFKCSRCGKRFPSGQSYEEHYSKHAGEKPFKCDLCPKQFNHKTDLRRHMCLHSGEKPYSCFACGKGFIRKDHMLKHCDTHRKKNATITITGL